VEQSSSETCRVFLGLNGVGIYYNGDFAAGICSEAAQLGKASKYNPHDLEVEIDSMIKKVSNWIKERAFTSSLDPVLPNMIRT